MYLNVRGCVCHIYCYLNVDILHYQGKIIKEMIIKIRMFSERDNVFVL